MASPECFFDAVLILDNKYYGDVSESINSPVFIEESEIKSVTDKYSVIPKYKDIIVRLGIKPQ